jgi:hypothetical protein
MRKIVLVAPGLVDIEGESVLRQSLPGLARITERGRLFGVPQVPDSETPEAMVLGLAPNSVRLAQGPLTISALGADPPPRSTHFHLTPMSTDGTNMLDIPLELPAEEVDWVMDRAKGLNTRALTIVPGEGKDHGLVWEGLGDLGTTAPEKASGHLMKDVLPEGDYEVALRRLIDDSINLLSEAEFNQIRIDQGMAPINVLWPWGQGVRTDVPNLAIRRGEPTQVMSPSLRLAGLSRLAGYRHLDRRILGNGLNANWREIANTGQAGTSTLVWTSAFAELRSEDQLEEAAWLAKRIDELWIEPILQSTDDVPTRLAVLASGNRGPGLAVWFESKWNEATASPFDERALEDRLPQAHLHELVDSLLSA